MDMLQISIAQVLKSALNYLPDFIKNLSWVSLLVQYISESEQQEQLLTNLIKASLILLPIFSLQISSIEDLIKYIQKHIEKKLLASTKHAITKEKVFHSRLEDLGAYAFDENIERYFYKYRESKIELTSNVINICTQIVAQLTAVIISIYKCMYCNMDNQVYKKEFLAFLLLLIGLFILVIISKYLTTDVPTDPLERLFLNEKKRKSLRITAKPSCPDYWYNLITIQTTINLSMIIIAGCLIALLVSYHQLVDPNPLKNLGICLLFISSLFTYLIKTNPLSKLFKSFKLIKTHKKHYTKTNNPSKITNLTLNFNGEIYKLEHRNTIYTSNTNEARQLIKAITNIESYNNIFIEEYKNNPQVFQNFATNYCEELKYKHCTVEDFFKSLEVFDKNKIIKLLDKLRMYKLLANPDLFNSHLNQNNLIGEEDIQVLAIIRAILLSETQKNKLLLFAPYKHISKKTMLKLIEILKDHEQDVIICQPANYLPE